MNIQSVITGYFGLAALTGLLASCSNPAIAPQTPAQSPTASPTPATTNSIAKISEIQKLPVFVRLLHKSQEQPAKEGMGLQTGETIRTQNQALAQVDLNNGLAFRISGDAVLTLQPSNRLNLTAGDMITWVQPGKKIPTEIVTPAAIAGIRGTTVFVNIPKNPKEGTLFFAWEGAVAIHLPGAKEEVLLKTAEEVRIKPGDRDIQQIRKRIRRLSQAEWRQKRQTDPILHSFKKAKMSTLPIINKIKPGQVSLNSPLAAASNVRLPGKQKKLLKAVSASNWRLSGEREMLIKPASMHTRKGDRDVGQVHKQTQQLKRAERQQERVEQQQERAERHQERQTDRLLHRPE